MIYKTELRIGNYVDTTSSINRYLIVTEITSQGLYLSDGTILDFELIEPIAITKEILAQSNFIYGRKYFRNDFYDLKEIQKENNEEVWLFMRNNESLRNIKYVHEVQNLFYNLTGEELKIIL